ncbi:MAG: CopD family protein [Gemmatimonadetes bacterium]|nr:CopD family protein [Gemmatimonadota bacterium]
MSDLPITGAPLLHSVARLSVFAALAALAGAWAFRAWVLRPALDVWPAPADWTGRALRRVAGQGVVAAWVLVPAAGLRLVAQVLEYLVPGESLAEALRFLLLDTTWGRAWIAQVAVAIAAIFAFRAAHGNTNRAWRVAGLVAILACLTPAFSGHANGVEARRTLAILADSAHVFAAGVWIGGLLALALVSATRTDGGPTRSDVLLRLLVRFSPVALASAAVLAISGTVGAWLHIPSWMDLFASTYGRVLLVKLALVLGVAAFGFRHWRVATPALGAGEDAPAFARTIALELTCAFAVLAVTALLTASPLPGE